MAGQLAVPGERKTSSGQPIYEAPKNREFVAKMSSPTGAYSKGDIVQQSSEGKIQKADLSNIGISTTSSSQRIAEQFNLTQAQQQQLSSAIVNFRANREPDTPIYASKAGEMVSGEPFKWYSSDYEKYLKENNMLKDYRGGQFEIRGSGQKQVVTYGGIVEARGADLGRFGLSNIDEGSLKSFSKMRDINERRAEEKEAKRIEQENKLSKEDLEGYYKSVNVMPQERELQGKLQNIRDNIEDYRIRITRAIESEINKLGSGQSSLISSIPSPIRNLMTNPTLGGTVISDIEKGIKKGGTILSLPIEGYKTIHTFGSYGASETSKFLQPYFYRTEKALQRDIELSQIKTGLYGEKKFKEGLSRQESGKYFRELQKQELLKGTKVITDLVSGASTSILKQYEKNPYLYTTQLPLIGFGLGMGNAIVSGAGTVAATQADIVGIGLFAGYGATKVAEYQKLIGEGFSPAKALGTVGGTTGLETTSFLGGATIGGNAARMLGFEPQPSAIPKLTFERLRGRTIEEAPKVYEIKNKELQQVFDRGFGKELDMIKSTKTGKYYQYEPAVLSKDYTMYNIIGYRNYATGRGGNIIGNQPGTSGIILGTPERIVFSPKLNSDIITFESPAQRQLIEAMGLGTRETALMLPGSPENILIKDITINPRQAFIEEFKLLKKGASKVPSKIYQQRLTRDIRSFKNKKSIDFTIKELNRLRTLIGKQASIKYGSATIKESQLRPLYSKQVGSTGDIDVQLLKSMGFSTKEAKYLAQQNKQLFGEPFYVTKQQPYLVQTRQKGVSHAIDIHPYSAAYDILNVPVQESFYGYPFFQKTIKIEKGKVIPLTEAHLRYASSVFTPRIRGGKVYFAPETHRAKDVSRLLITGKELSEQTIGVKGGRGVIDVARSYKYFKVPKTREEAKSPSPSFSLKGRVSRLPFKIESISPKRSVSLSKSPSPYRSLSRSIYASSKASASASRSVSASISPSLSPSPSKSPSRSPSPSISPSLSPSPSPSPSISPSLSPSPSPSPSISPSKSPSPSESIIPSIYFGIQRGKKKKAKRTIPRTLRIPKGYVPTLYRPPMPLKRLPKGFIGTGTEFMPRVKGLP